MATGRNKICADLLKARHKDLLTTKYETADGRDKSS